MSDRCSICAKPQVTAIDADLAAGLSIRAKARKWLASRSSLARHARHAIDRPDTAVQSDRGRDPFSEALRLLSRARSERERLRGLEAVRAALNLELKDHARVRTSLKIPDEAQARQLARNVEAAWEHYERVSEGSHDLAQRALQGVRESSGTTSSGAGRRNQWSGRES